MPNSTGGYNTRRVSGALFERDRQLQHRIRAKRPFQLEWQQQHRLGYEAGFNLKTGSNNIEIGNKGAAGDNKLIKIGTRHSSQDVHRGNLQHTTVSGLAVVIGSNGELGAVSSSERFKTDVEPMAENTARLRQLRP